MADDTRPESGVQTVQIENMPPRPRAPANSMPGGTAHTAGGEKVDGEGPSYIDAVRSLGPEYYMNFHKRPCVRDSQLQGLAAGFAGGAVAGIIGSTSSLVQSPTPSAYSISWEFWAGRPAFVAALIHLQNPSS
jgi:cytochrome c oxidase assembly protein subunit 20